MDKPITKTKKSLRNQVANSSKTKSEFKETELQIDLLPAVKLLYQIYIENITHDKSINM